ncbi:MAG: amino acid ABC transporter permease [Desulfotignum sp.]|nr:amino acid ABC transporter permease [Desulfotignum sp.]MCF8125638.1 amino acid ABC transporter permease [Desulfotignum sp.]
MLNKPVKPLTLVDLAVVAAVAAGVIFFFVRMVQVLDYQWNWQAIPGYFLYKDPETGRFHANMLLQGFGTTLKLSIWSMVLGFVLGTFSGIMGARGGFAGKMISRFYVETVRNIPSLVLVILFYYFVSSQFLDALGLDQWVRNQPEPAARAISLLLAGSGQINAFVSAAVALAIYEGAYISEIVRGGINGVSTGQWEAAWSLGLSPFNTFRLVVLPQTFRRAAFPLAGQFISTIKDSAIVSVISVQELTFQGMELMAATFLTFEIWITITLLYFILTFSLSRSISFFEKRLAIRQ